VLADGTRTWHWDGWQTDEKTVRVNANLERQNAALERLSKVELDMPEKVTF
jgi:hypothetical protein